MNREILFKAKNIITNEWVYGDLDTSRKSDGLYYINDGKYDHSVIPETIGQYKGLLNKDKIFEGDLIKFTGDIEHTFKTYRGRKGSSYTESRHRTFGYAIYKVECSLEEGFKLTLIKTHAEECFNKNLIWFFARLKPYPSDIKNSIVEVIGNIHDNPELLK